MYVTNGAFFDDLYHYPWLHFYYIISPTRVLFDQASGKPRLLVQRLVIYYLCSQFCDSHFDILYCLSFDSS
jgi:hypothetical protein